MAGAFSGIPIGNIGVRTGADFDPYYKELQRITSAGLESQRLKDAKKATEDDLAMRKQSLDQNQSQFESTLQESQTTRMAAQEQTKAEMEDRKAARAEEGKRKDLELQMQQQRDASARALGQKGIDLEHDRFSLDEKKYGFALQEAQNEKDTARESVGMQAAAAQAVASDADRVLQDPQAAAIANGFDPQKDPEKFSRFVNVLVATAQAHKEFQAKISQIQQATAAGQISAEQMLQEIDKARAEREAAVDLSDNKEYNDTAAQRSGSEQKQKMVQQQAVELIQAWARETDPKRRAELFKLMQAAREELDKATADLSKSEMKLKGIQAKTYNARIKR